MTVPKFMMTIACSLPWVGLTGMVSPTQGWAQSFSETNPVSDSRIKNGLGQSTENCDFSDGGRSPNRIGGGSHFCSNSTEFQFPEPGRSGNRTGGGSRSDCPNVDVPLTALVPLSSSGTTLSSHPTLWFYVPYDNLDPATASPNSDIVGEFVIQDRDRNDIYRLDFTLSATPGLVSVSLPETEPPMEINQQYRWYFGLYCDTQKTSSPSFVYGRIERTQITVELEQQLNEDPTQQDIVYATHQIWFDALHHLAHHRLTQPADPVLIQRWNTLLNAQGVNLEIPSQVPFLGNVQPIADQPVPQP